MSQGDPPQTWVTGGPGYPGADYIVRSRVQIYFETLVDTIETLSTVVKSKIAMIQAKKSAMSIGDMFDLQMAMNRLSQFSEMSTSVIAAMNTSINSMARNIKG